MSFGAVVLFDEGTEREIRRLWQAQQDAGLPSFMLGVDYPPHLTILGAESADMSALRAELPGRIAALPPLPVQFLSLGVFPAQYGVVFLTPVTNTQLLALHEALWRAIHPHTINPGAHYQPGVWVPHVTMAFNVPQDKLGEVTAFLANQPFPTGARIDRLMIGEFHLEGGSRLETFRLGG